MDSDSSEAAASKKNHLRPLARNSYFRLCQFSVCDFAFLRFAPNRQHWHWPTLRISSSWSDSIKTHERSAINSLEIFALFRFFFFFFLYLLHLTEFYFNFFSYERWTRVIGFLFFSSWHWQWQNPFTSRSQFFWINVARYCEAKQVKLNLNISESCGIWQGGVWVNLQDWFLHSSFFLVISDGKSLETFSFHLAVYQVKLKWSSETTLATFDVY